MACGARRGGGWGVTGTDPWPEPQVMSSSVWSCIREKVSPLEWLGQKFMVISRKFPGNKTLLEQKIILEIRGCGTGNSHLSQTTTHKRDTQRTRTTAAAGTAGDALRQHGPRTPPGEKFGERLLRTATTRAAPRRTFPHRRTTRPFTELRRSPRSSPRLPCGRLRAPKLRGYLTDHRSSA